MARERQGFISKRKDENGKVRLFVRIQYTDETGRRREKMRRAENMAEARKLQKQLVRELGNPIAVELDQHDDTFADLAQAYIEHKLFPAKLVNGRKIAGLKSLSQPKAAVEMLRTYFGNQRLKSITPASVERFKMTRLEKLTIRGTHRQVSSVNRELEQLRAMFRFAVREGRIMRSPFEMGSNLISKTDETRRERTITYAEEAHLLQLFSEPKRAHMRPLFIAALDTGARRGELFKLRWREVDLSGRAITILAENSKTERPRIIGMTQRLHDELSRLWQTSAHDNEQLVFGVRSTIKTAWLTACRSADIKGLRWHDLRHSAITRMVETGQPTELIKKVSGHTQATTFARYVNPTLSAITQIADALSALNLQRQELRSSPSSHLTGD